MRRPHAPRLPTRWRITGWVVGSVLLVTVAGGVFAVLRVESQFTSQIDEELAIQASSMGAALDVLDPAQLEAIADDPGFADTTYGIAIVGIAEEPIVVSSGPIDDPDPPIDLSPSAIASLRGRAGPPFDLGSADGSTTYRAIVRQIDEGGLVVVTRSLDERDDAVRAVIGALLAAGAVAAVLVSVTVAVVSALVTRPLDAMIDAAEEIGEGDMTSRVPTDGVEDVTRLATALNAMLDRLEQAFADRAASEDALRRFVADASHELRTPLSAVLGYAELHETGMVPADQAPHAMARIRAEGERMRLIVEELLTLARLDEGRPMDVAPVDLVELARVAVADAGAVESDRTIDLDVPGRPVEVAGDVMSLRQAIDNLLANARTHTPPGTPVRVTVSRDGDHAEVEVADEGPGMGPEDLTHVFDRFYRADPSRARPGGSGLGLAIVKAIAAAHGGEVAATSRPGEGATFTVRLPVDGPADRASDDVPTTSTDGR